ncbi:hypothetical protein M409DRAFT_21914 [Zasmidium cellare ATCC 36951]|uniref:AB hydrolase-1 domain-containing protein n=1 Tax=Zasmidium cellare ATCC 36951 TaxID=1080233 RepID=A0A6A6CMC0_ZASCE|nr:uncharacterized protein M409DRAFT_21914 [Zasmidium cellare ATCC 36951]KAF2167763.1 hypothetical protein M409DRAFT_21914 [Zasmidium cellare ATCC 36951]
MSPPQTQDPNTAFSTNPSSLFTPFTLRLANNAILTGITHIPSSGLFHTSPTKPLLIAIHGATCSAHNYDINPQYNASTYSALTGITFVAFHRPNYLGSSGWIRKADTFDKPAQGVSDFEEEARWYHEYIFPLLWEEFGLKNGCSALVTTSHSMAVATTIIAAGYYSQTAVEARKYPWAGMVGFGLGEEPTAAMLRGSERLGSVKWKEGELPLGQEEDVHIGPFGKEDKLALMLGPEGCCGEELRELCWRQNTPFLLNEVVDLNGVWRERKEVFKGRVEIPVLYGVGTMEWLWKHEGRHVEMFTRGFVKAPRVEGAVISGAPHAIEWSPMAGGWWLRVFGWAAEVTASREVEGWGLEEFE